MPSAAAPGCSKRAPSTELLLHGCRRTAGAGLLGGYLVFKPDASNIYVLHLILCTGSRIDMGYRQQQRAPLFSLLQARTNADQWSDVQSYH